MTKKNTYQGVQTLEVLEQANNYNKWIAQSVGAYIIPPVLEIGAGLGNITTLLTIHKPFLATDKDPNLVKILRKKFKNKKEMSFGVLDIERGYSKNKMNFFNSVFSVNVLEHIKNDVVALKNMKRVLKPGGVVVLLVPANHFAYTQLDRELGHFRRYSKKELQDKLREAGFVDIRIKHFNIVGLASWVVRDKIWKKNSGLLASQVAIFEKVVPILKFIESLLPMPIGISLIAVARKGKR